MSPGVIVTHSVYKMNVLKRIDYDSDDSDTSERNNR